MRNSAGAGPTSSSMGEAGEPLVDDAEREMSCHAGREVGIRDLGLEAAASANAHLPPAVFRALGIQTCLRI